MLKVIGAAPGAKAERDWPETWKESHECAEMRRELERLEQGVAANGSTSSPDEMSTYAALFHVQLALCTERVFQQYWRTPSYIYSKLILSGGTVSFNAYW